MLIRRGKTYHFRQWIPLKLRTVFGCKEIVRSLKTTDRGQAKLFARLLEHEAEWLFHLVRSGMLEYSQIDMIVEDFKRCTLDRLTEERRKQGAIVYLPPRLREKYEDGKNPDKLIDEILSQYSARKRTLAQNVQINNYTGVTELAEQLLTEKGIEDSKDSKPFRMLCEYLLKAQIEVSQSVIDRMKGKCGQTYDTAPVFSKKGPAPKLSELFGAYKANKIAKGNWNDASTSQYERFLADTIEIIGDKALTEYRDSDPLSLISAFKGIGNSAGTITGKVEFVSSLFKYALKTPKSRDRWRVLDNPFTEMQVENTGDDKPDKIAYTQTDLVKLVTGLLEVRKMVEPHRFWVPLIALYSGARQNDVCQLRVADVHEDVGGSGVLVFDFCHKPSLKQTNKAKKTRVCPVHPMLKRLGLLKYHEAQKSAGHDLLFSTLSHSKGKKWTGKIRTWWNETYQKTLLEDTAGKSFHSLRKSFINWFKQNECYDTYSDRSIVQSMIGHDEDDVTGAHYEEDYPPQTKLKMLVKLDYGFPPELITALRDKEF